MVLPSLDYCKVAIVGMGYVGLPLAIQCDSVNNNHSNTNSNISRKIIGFDINSRRINQLIENFDETNEVSKKQLLAVKNIFFTSDENKLIDQEVFIVCVPTPIDIKKKPDFKPLSNACKLIGKILKKKFLLNNNKFDSQPIIIFESTVYPGATEEICVSILERESDLKYNQSNNSKTFFCGYSPERINPGDKTKNISDIVKVTSGSNDEVSNWVNEFYKSFIKAGTFKARSIKVAEAAKVIENTQRDLNIALINELAIIFNHLDIDTEDVMKAAETKWNFISFRPGLVGGHCIGVDPYYLTYKSEQLGYKPEVVLAGRKINDCMSEWIANLVDKKLQKSNSINSQKKILILGFTFKENCPDFRNTKSIEVYEFLNRKGYKIDVVDPVVLAEQVYKKHSIKLLNSIPKYRKYEAIICLVAHDIFKEFSIEYWESILDEDGKLFDLKGIIPRDLNPIRI